MDYSKSSIEVGKPIRRLDSRRYAATNRQQSAQIDRVFTRLSKIKQKITSRLFWGRNNFYRNFIHATIVLLTIFITISGIAYNIQADSAVTNISLGDNIVGTSDLLEQGSSIESVLVENPNLLNIKTTRHTVKEGETLESIASQYGVSSDTIRWASKDVVSPFTDRIEVGWILTVPSIDGVLYEVRKGQTLDQIIADASSSGNTEANKYNIIEFNALKAPYTLEEGDFLFIPDGNLKDSSMVGPLADIPRGVFVDPLSHPDCQGYSYSRGYTSYHDGVDLARWPGCPISAIANGTVVYAGWKSQGEGYMVEIDHGGGIKSRYYHGEGTFWVKTGDRVKQGQPLLMMGSTGNSTGVHLHFCLFKDGIAVDPYGYVPYLF